MHEREMSNFAFLDAYDPRLAETCRLGERYMYTDPNGCLNKMRSATDEFAMRIIEDHRLIVDAGPRGETTFASRVNALRRSHVVPATVANDMDSVRRSGNGGSHHVAQRSQRDAEKGLRATYRIAVWFMRDYRGENLPIQPFRLPQRPVAESASSAAENKPPGTHHAQKPSPANAAAGVLGSRWARIAAGFAGGLGMAYLWNLSLDPEHRGAAALRRTIRLALLIAVAALLLLPLLLFAHGMSLWSAYTFLFDGLALRLGMNQFLARAFALLWLVPLAYATGLFLSPRNAENRRRGTLLLVGLAVGWNVMFYLGTRGDSFGPDGSPLKHYVRTDHGFVVYDHPGFDPETGQKLLPLTPDIARIIALCASGSIHAVNPATATWFNANTANPMLWYYRDPNGNLELYDCPGMHPKTGDPLQPVTRELYLGWQASTHEQPPAKAETPVAADPLYNELHAALSPAHGPGAAGILVLQHGAGDRDGAQALIRQLAAENTFSFRSDALQLRGLGPRLLDGDPKLVRQTLAITNLKSLVVADVKVECAKRSSLDPDLLSCDLTATAHKYDQNGSPAGSTQAHAAGAGYSQAEAVDLAAQRASGELAAFANR